jgi:hypothetical protein
MDRDWQGLGTGPGRRAVLDWGKSPSILGGGAQHRHPQKWVFAPDSGGRAGSARLQISRSRKALTMASAFELTASFL